MRALKFVLFAGVSAVASAAHAQTAPREEGPPEIVVTAAPFALREDAALSNVDALNRAELDAMPAGGLGEALSGLTGVRSSFFGPGASRPVIRGLSGPRVQVLTNGVGQIDASALSPDHAVATDPLEATRIEVIRGPAALAYGGSAIGGVVNILDERVPSIATTDGLDGRVTMQGSSVDDGRQAAASLKAGTGPWVFALDALTRESDDYEVPVYPESRRLLAEEGEEAGEERTVENTAVELDQFGAGASYVTGLGFLGVSVKRTETLYGVPGHSHGHEEEEEHGGEEEHEHGEEGVRIDLEQTRYDLRGELNVGVGPFDKIRLSSGFADYEHVELEGDEIGTTFTSEGWEGRLEFVQRERDGRNGAVGLQALSRDLTAVGDEAYVPASETSELGAFTVQRLDKDAWGLEGGLRLDRREIETAAASRDFTNYSASAGVFLRPSETSFLGLSVARTARAPTDAELFAEGPHIATGAYEIGDADLDSEIAYTLELTGHYETGPLSLDAHAFVAKYDGFIDLRPTGDVFSEEDEACLDPAGLPEEEAEEALPCFDYRQTDADFYGFEVEGAWRLWEEGGRGLHLEGAYDFVRGDTDLGDAARIPPWSLTGRLVWHTPVYDVRLEARRVGEQDRVAEFELPTDGYTLVNLFGSVKPFRDKGLILFAEARNLTDEEAREHVSFLKDLAPLPGRNIRAGLTYRF